MRKGRMRENSYSSSGYSQNFKPIKNMEKQLINYILKFKKLFLK